MPPSASPAPFRQLLAHIRAFLPESTRGYVDQVAAFARQETTGRRV